MKKSYCEGCYNNIYNNGAGGAKECWSFETAKIIWRKEIHINEYPPFKQKPKRFPNCYYKPKYVYIGGNKTNF